MGEFIIMMGEAIASRVVLKLKHQRPSLPQEMYIVMVRMNSGVTISKVPKLVLMQGQH